MRSIRIAWSRGNRRWWLPLTLVLAALGIAACGGDVDQDTVRPFSEVQDGDMTFEPDPADPTRGIFRVTTTEAMICAIVWGEDDSFGRFNNSLAMSGTGIVQHDVVLPDVDAGREYTFVVQGTTADGTLFRSDVSTFTIDAGEEATVEGPDELGVNLALGATVVEASSSFSDAFAPENAIDDDGLTEWSSDGDGDDASITIDLGQAREIAAVEFVTRSMADGSAIAETFTISIDDGAPLGPFSTGTAAARRIVPLVAEGQVVRFDVETSSGGNVGAVQIRIFAPA